MAANLPFDHGDVPMEVMLAELFGECNAADLPLLYLRDGSLVLPERAAQSWCWGCDGLTPDEAVAWLVAAGMPPATEVG